MADSSWTRWLRSLFHPRRNKTIVKRNRRPIRPHLEALEDRTLLSALPEAVVSNQRAIGGSTNAQVILDPINANKLITVSDSGGFYSVNGGATWTALTVNSNLP